MVRAATTIGILTVVLLIVVIALGMTESSPTTFSVAVEILPWVLVASSLSMGTVLWRAGSTALATCLFANVAMIAAAVAFLIAAGTLNRSVLWVADLWWLNVHLIALAIIARGR